ncbi:hypothetical protein [Francisella sp. 19X1-34]|uniref:hypothetical protein n=1 Tax=Francisella sp. 19X1-34 TaxID=3087177 RepID=UPI002E369C9A|nr:hypothetical protein [Francisella sp. 19X1-34]MED7787548.1 hypothetical protein [Francisella sp. 19X1-34]
MKKKNKVLHIGNIANNAYLNAKILNSDTDIKSDVLSLNYYHIMGCPEWEDYDFKEDYGDDFNPKWDNRNFKRPSWFSSGNGKFAIKYLIHKNKGNNIRALIYRCLAKYKKTLNLSSNLGIVFKDAQFLFIALAIAFVKVDFQYVKSFFKNKTGGLRDKIIYKSFITILLLLTIPLWPLFIVFAYFHIKLGSKAETSEIEASINRLYTRLVNLAKSDYIPTKKELEPYIRTALMLEELFNYYDLIIGYGIEGIYPLLLGEKYIAFEHGTIRNLPFQNTPLGFVTRVTYEHANHVIITNADNLLAAQNLKLKKYTFVPHPINEEPLIKISNDYEDLHSRYNTDFIAFHPSRQHWEKDVRHPDWEKGNDIFIEGFAKFVRDVNSQAKAILISWGLKVEDSKSLIESLGIQDNIIWLKPKGTYEMTRTILGIDLLADQFYLGAFGSTAPRAWLCSKPSMLYLNEDMHEWCFDEMPINIQAKSPEDVFDGLKYIYSCVVDNKHEFGEKSREWYKKHHSNSVIREKLVRIIDSL